MLRLNKHNINTPEFFNKKFNGTFGLHDMERLNQLIKYYKGGVYADVGCMDSPIPALLAEHKENEVYAFDFAGGIIDFLAPRFPKVKYRRIGDACELPFQNESVDYLVAGEMIEHLEDPKKFVQEAKRVVKKGGWIAISTPFEETISQGKIGGEQHVWAFTMEDIKDMFGECETELLKEQGGTSILIWHQK